MTMDEIAFYVSWGISFSLVVGSFFLRFFPARHRLQPERSLALLGHARNPIAWRAFSFLECPRLSLGAASLAFFLVLWTWRINDRESSFPPRYLPSYVAAALSVVSLVLLTGISFVATECSAWTWTFTGIEAGLWALVVAICMLQEKKRAPKGMSQSPLLSQIGIVVFFETLARAAFDVRIASVFAACAQAFVSVRLLWPWIWMSVNGRRDKIEAYYTAIHDAGGELRCAQEMICTPSGAAFLNFAETETENTLQGHSVRAIRAGLDYRSGRVLLEDFQHAYMSGALSLGSSPEAVERRACLALDKRCWKNVVAQIAEFADVMDEENSGTSLIEPAAVFVLSEEDEDETDMDVTYANIPKDF